MKGKAVIPLVLGLGIGIFAIKMFVNVLNKAKGSPGETVQILRARVDLAPTIEITDQMIEIVAVPESLCPKLSIKEKAEVIGRVTANSIPQGCPIVQSLLAPKGTLPGMAARIKDGFRAVAVKVDESIGVAGWVKPGSHVDVIAVMSGKGGGNKNETVSRLILQNLEVLAVGQDIGNSGDTNASVPKSVTLLVSPEDVPKLHLAATKGALRLSMRNQYDSTPLSETASTSENEILGISSVSESEVRRGSLWDGIFSKLPKNTLKATDKPVGPGRGSLPQAVAVATPQPAWVVEVLSGGRSGEMAFSGSDKHARWVDPAKVPAPAPAPTAEQPSPEQHESTELEANPPEPAPRTEKDNTASEKAAATEPSSTP